MKTRRERAEGFTDGDDGLEAPTWGRVKRLARLVPRILEDFPALGAEGLEIELSQALEQFPDLGDLVLALYLMPFEKFRCLTPENYRKECDEFAAPIPMSDAGHCLTAILRDWDALQASLVELAESGKVPGLEVAQNHSQPQNSKPPVSASV